VINVYKPPGPSSFGVVQAVKGMLHADKAGHLGTLDPTAEGVLPICVGRATKVIRYLVSLPKVYRAIMLLGGTTDTQDASGKMLETRDPSAVGDQDVVAAFKDFFGTQEQVPPMFSAKKKNGIPLYKLARNGITINREPVVITVHDLEFIKKEGNRVEFRVHCSAGTYVRTLCHDMGIKLGCGAHLEHLVRERVGRYDIRNALPLERLKNLQESGDSAIATAVETPEQALSFLPQLQVKEDRLPALAHGAALAKSALQTLPERIVPGMLFRVHDGENRLLAIVEPVADRETIGRLDDNAIAFKSNRVFMQ
jgi:tRNA pseudouridine55 synthase